MKVNKLVPAALAILLLTAGCGPGEPAALEPDELPYYTFRLPADFEPEEEYPLLVVLHGEGRDENEVLALWDGGCFIAPGFILLAVRGPFRADGGYGWLRPEGNMTERKAAAVTGEHLVMDIVADFEHQFRIDPDWRFVAGIGEAGSTALYTAFKHPDIFQGTAVLSGPVDADVISGRLVRNLDDMDIFLGSFQGAEKDSVAFDRAGARVLVWRGGGTASDQCRAMQEFFGLMDTAAVADTL
ncbi:MAG: alpha/beta hydrolase-fold protein [candidate division WOR-3 bacterium]